MTPGVAVPSRPSRSGQLVGLGLGLEWHDGGLGLGLEFEG